MPNEAERQDDGGQDDEERTARRTLVVFDAVEQIEELLGGIEPPLQVAIVLRYAAIISIRNGVGADDFGAAAWHVFKDAAGDLSGDGDQPGDPG